MLKKMKLYSKLLLLILCCSLLLPCFSFPFAKADTYATESAIIQVRTQDSAYFPMCTIQLYTQADTYEDGAGNWRILHYTSGIFNEYHFQWVPIWWWIFIIDWETRFVYEILDINWYQFTVPGLGIIIAGSTWRFKLYERHSPGHYFIFDLQAYVMAGGGTDVAFTPIESSSNGWHHYAEEIDWNEIVGQVLGEWLDDHPY
jgi:hypothetical protein